MTPERSRLLPVVAAPPLALTAPPATPPPLTEPPPTGLDDLGPEDARIAHLRIRQPLTEDAPGVPEGSWYFPSRPEEHALGRQVVLLAVRSERALRLPHPHDPEAAEVLRRRIEEKTGVSVPADWRGPACFSRDRIVPVKRSGIDPLSADCLGCPMTRWRTVRGKRVQDCAETYRVLFFDLTAQLPCVFYARGSGYRPTRELLAALKVACRRYDRPAFAFTVGLSTRHVEVSGGSGGYFVPVFGPPEPIEDLTQVAFLADVHRACAGSFAAGA